MNKITFDPIGNPKENSKDGFRVGLESVPSCTRKHRCPNNPDFEETLMDPRPLNPDFEETLVEPVRWAEVWCPECWAGCCAGHYRMNPPGSDKYRVAPDAVDPVRKLLSGLICAGVGCCQPVTHVIPGKTAAYAQCSKHSTQANTAEANTAVRFRPDPVEKLSDAEFVERVMRDLPVRYLSAPDIGAADFVRKVVKALQSTGRLA